MTSLDYSIIRRFDWFQCHCLFVSVSLCISPYFAFSSERFCQCSLDRCCHRQVVHEIYWISKPLKCILMQNHDWFILYKSEHQYLPALKTEHDETGTKFNCTNEMLKNWRKKSFFHIDHFLPGLGRTLNGNLISFTGYLRAHWWWCSYYKSEIGKINPSNPMLTERKKNRNRCLDCA